MRRCFIVLCWLLIPIVSVAQSASGSVTGRVTAKGYLKGFGQVSSAVSDVIVEACTAKDTSYTTIVNGIFQFKKVTAGRVVLRFSHMSYKDAVLEVEVKPGETTEVEVKMQEAPIELESATVKGEIPVLTVKGDTLVYHAAAVRTLEGDETLRIVEQLPGVTASEQGVNVMGKDISRTYVDGKLIFGNDPMAALQNLLANDVVKIRVYDEYEEDNPRRKRRKGEDMRRVFDIETKSKLIQAATGHFLASYGADMNDGDQGNRHRYGVGITTNFFSEKLLLSANAFLNNINRKSNKITDIIAVNSPKSNYERTAYANIGMEKKWASKLYDGANTSLKAYYTYGNDYTLSENRSRQNYFPSSDYASRLYADTSRNILTAKYHKADLFFDHPVGITFSHNMRFSDDSSEGYRSYESIVDEGMPAGGQTRSFDKLNQYDISDRLLISNFIYFDATFNAANNDGSGFRTDTLTSTATHRELHSTSYGLSRKADVRLSKRIVFSEERYNYLDFAYFYIWEKSRRKKTSLDLADAGKEIIDTTNTYDFTNNNNTHKAVIELNLSFPKIKADLNIKSAFSTTGINRDELFPDNAGYNKRFNAFLPSVSFTSSKMTSQWQVLYMTSAQIPSVEQLRPRLDDANPYMLVAGNQNLKQSYTHHLRCTYSTMFGKANNSFSFVFNLKKTDNMIAYKRTFFTQETPLPEWDYTAPAQSTLTTYENVDGMWAADADITWVHPFPRIKSQLTVNPKFNYDDLPSFVGDALNRTKSYAPLLRLGLRANISRSFRFSVGSTTSYIYSKNDIGQDNKYFQQTASVNTELTNIFKYLYLNTTYSLSYHKRFGGDNYDMNNQILNVAVGCKILKRRCDISFTAYDLLNRNSGYKTLMHSDYILNTWTHSFGRYFTFNIAYKFNRSKTGVTNRSVKDGSVSEY